MTNMLANNQEASWKQHQSSLACGSHRNIALLHRSFHHGQFCHNGIYGNSSINNYWIFHFLASVEAFENQSCLPTTSYCPTV